jgi:hypothetical protein
VIQFYKIAPISFINQILWGCAFKSNIAIIERCQSKIPRATVDEWEIIIRERDILISEVEKTHKWPVDKRQLIKEHYQCFS